MEHTIGLNYYNSNIKQINYVAYHERGVLDTCNNYLIYMLNILLRVWCLR